MMNLTYAIALLSLLRAAAAGFLDAQHEHIVPMPKHSYKGDCGKKVSLRIIPSAATLLQQDNVPGAGIDIIDTEFKPFTTALKDGYMMMDCVKDYMYYRGDKYGDKKVDYKLGPVSRVSIVHYEAFVAKEDRAKMTPRVCFEFCRTVPNMGFFGITNGRSCYCTPYFTAMESDSSQCDSSCEGNGSPLCGGKTKSTMYTMHMCASTQQDLLDRSDNARSLGMALRHTELDAKQLVKNMEGSAADIQKRFGRVGDSGMSDLAQQAIVIAGKLDHSANHAHEIMQKLEDSAQKAFRLEKQIASHGELSSSLAVQAEGLMEQIDETVAAGEAAYDELEKLMAMVSPKPLSVSEHQPSKNYYPVMHFIDKKFDGLDDPKTKRDGSHVPGVPTTCSGDLVGKPLATKNREACASACDDNLANGCIGFQHVSYTEDELPVDLCFLFSSFKTGFYYTKCDSRKTNTNNFVGCWAKFSRFEGTTLTPDPKGKCKECFKKFTKADRCYIEK